MEWEEFMSFEVQFQAELLECMAEAFSDCSPDCLQVVKWIADGCVAERVCRIFCMLASLFLTCLVLFCTWAC